MQKLGWSLWQGIAVIIISVSSVYLLGGLVIFQGIDLRIFVASLIATVLVTAWLVFYPTFFEPTRRAKMREIHFKIPKRPRPLRAQRRAKARAHHKSVTEPVARKLAEPSAHTSTQSATGINDFAPNVPPTSQAWKLPHERSILNDYDKIKVGLKRVMESAAFRENKGGVRIALGEDTRGAACILDLARMSHLLITGTTGSGKSISIRSILACLLLTHTPDTLRLLLADPTIVELSPFNYIPHLLTPVEIETSGLDNILLWANREMEKRHSLISMARRSDLSNFNMLLVGNGENPWPRILIVIDGVAGFIDYESRATAERLRRLAKLGHTVGIHILVTTQSVQVPGLGHGWQYDFPTRIAMATASANETNAVFTIPNAQRASGNGELLLETPKASALVRLQGTYVSEDEVSEIARYWRHTKR